MKLLSVAIPAYNVEQYLPDAVESLVRCRRAGDMDILIVDDGSRDGTLALARAYEKQYPGVVTAVHQENGGHGAAVNTGVRLAAGKYFLVLDGDDWAETPVLDEFLDFLETRDADILVTGHIWNYTRTGEEILRSYPEKQGFTADMDYLLERGYLLPMPDLCFRTDFLRKAGLPLQEHTFYVDEEYCSFPFRTAKTVTFFSKAFYHYRIGDSAQSTSPTNIARLAEHRARVFRRIASETEWDKLESANRAYLRRRIKGIANSVFCADYLYCEDRKKGRKMAESFYRELRDSFPEAAGDCRNIRLAFSVMNRLHVSWKMWESYQRWKRKKRGR